MADTKTTVGVVRESGAGERRVALVPKAAASLVNSGVAVVVESGAGESALLPDDLYTEAGATVGDAWAADVVVKVAPPTADEVARLRSGQTLIGFLAPRNADNQIDALTKAGVQAFALEAIPRISRAQAMDALSSQGNVAGYKAVLLAASESTRFFPMLTTAAGTVKPARVLVLGVGVAGLQALATAKRLGARTTGYDVRPEVADQVRSVGAQWLSLGEKDVAAAGEGGYARELTDEERAQQQKALEEAIAGFDVVITTALVPGRPAPRLVTAAAVAGHEAGQRRGRPGRRDRRQLRADRTGRGRRQARRDDRLAAEPACHHARARQRAVFEEHHRAAGPVAQRRRAGTGLRRRSDRGVLRHTRRERREKLERGIPKNV